MISVGSGLLSLPLGEDWPVQHFYSSILDAWRFRVSAKLAEREGFRGAEFVDYKGSLQLLVSFHLRERD